MKSLSPSLFLSLGSSMCFNQPPIPLRTDTPQSPQLPHQSPSPPDYSPTEVGPGDHAGLVKASTSLEPPLVPCTTVSSELSSPAVICAYLHFVLHCLCFQLHLGESLVNFTYVFCQNMHSSCHCVESLYLFTMRLVNCTPNLFITTIVPFSE